MQDLLAEVRESIATVLDEQSDSLAVHAHIDGKLDLSERVRELARDLGWLAISLPEENDGIGLGAQGLALLNYELGRAAAPGALLASSVAVETLARSDADCVDLIGDVVAGTATLALAATPGRPQRDGMVWLLGDPSARAALIAGEGDDVALATFDAAQASKLDLWDETQAVFAVPASALSVTQTLPGMRKMLTALYAVAVAADSAGAARGTLDRTVRYMKEREQFGRPIGSFQALKHRAADHHVNAKSADELVWQAAEAIDAGDPGALLWATMAKANATEAAAQVAGDCVQLHGGVGFTREYDPHLYMKRIRFDAMLIAPNGALRDEAERELRAVLATGHDVLEIVG